MKNSTINYFKSKQAVFPLFISDYLDICDPVLFFDRFMEGINLEKYLSVIMSAFKNIRLSSKNMLKRYRFAAWNETVTQKQIIRLHLNDQLLPAYNVQFGITDEYIAVADVNQYRSDMDCFVPLLKKFHETYGRYPNYPVADAGYGSYNNYIYCEQHGMEKYMKFTMYKKETTSAKYRDNPFRAVKFKIDEEGTMRCPAGKAFHFKNRQNVKGNQYGRQEEVYPCENCTDCPYATQCKKTDKNRTIRLNQELTSMHQEVVENLESIHESINSVRRYFWDSEKQSLV